MTLTIIDLEQTISDFNESLKIRSFIWAHQPAPGKWSKKQIIGHLIDSAQINLQRFIRCTYEEDFKLVYFQQEWVDAQHYQEADVNDLLQLWQLLNKQIIRVLANYPANRVNTRCDTDRDKVSLHDVEWLARDYVVHLKHHLGQVLSKK